MILEMDLFFPQIQEEREALPLKNFESEILDAIHHNSVVVIRGATGCGKTTQVPQYILDEYIRTNRAAECNIVVTQVRNVWPLHFCGGYEKSPVGIKSWNCGMVGIGRDLKAHLISTPFHGQQCHPLDEVAPSPIQPVPEGLMDALRDLIIIAGHGS